MLGQRHNKRNKACHTECIEHGGAVPKARFVGITFGGEQQRVALARAMVNNPPVLIADEPTGNLDPATAFDIMQLLEDINKRGTTVLTVTHARDIVDKMKKRVIEIDNGTIIRDGVGGYANECKSF